MYAWQQPMAQFWTFSTMSHRIVVDNSKVLDYYNFATGFGTIVARIPL